MTTLLGYPSDDLHARGGDQTAREIAQQPALWREVAQAAAASRDATEAFLRPLLDRSELRIVLTGAGTSAFAGAVLAPVLAGRLGRRVDACATTDIVSNPRECFVEDVPTLIVSFARSGDSPESVAATAAADDFLSDCSHFVVTCNPDGALAREHEGRPRSRVVLMPAAANDQGFAMTSSFTCMVLAAMLTLDDAGAGVPVERLAIAAERVLTSHAADARRLAAQDTRRIVYLGSGALNGLARESALKVLELTAGRVVALFDSPLGFRHGPKAVLDERTLAVVYISNDPYTRKYDADIVAELRRSLPAGRVIAIGAGDTHLPPDEGDWQLPGVHDVDDAMLGLPGVVCAQLIALAFSVAKGCTPDDPFPSGDVSRVVRRVTLHERTRHALN